MSDSTEKQFRAGSSGNFSESRYDRWQMVVNLFKYRDPFFPRRINLTISDWCNRHCSYCPNSIYGSPKTLISEEVFTCAIKRMQEINWTGMVSFNGYGEPLATKTLENYVARVKQAVPKARCFVYTNGDYLTVDRARSLFSAGVEHFMVTRHEPYSSQWDAKMLEVTSQDYGHAITVRCLPKKVITNVAGLTKVAFEPFSRCLLPSVGLLINVNGDISLCCADYLREVSPGNILKNTIKEIWNKPSYRRIRKNLILGNKKALPALCVRCMAGHAEEKAP